MRRLSILCFILVTAGCGGGSGGDTTASTVRPSSPVPQPLTPTAGWTPYLTGNTPLALHRIDRLRQLSGTNGQGIRIGVVGTGANAHVEISGRIDIDSFGVYQGSMNTGVAYTGSGSDPVLLDENRYEDLPGMGHDTGTSSLAAGLSLGAAPAASLVEAKVFWRVQDASGNTFDQTTGEIVAQAFNILAQRNVQVINASIGWGDTPATALTLLTDIPGRVTRALRTVLNNDTAIMLAAGNNGAFEGYNAFLAASQGFDTLYEDAAAMSKVLVAWSYSRDTEDIASWSNRPGEQAFCDQARLSGTSLNRCHNIISAAQNAYIGIWSDAIQVADAQTATGYLLASGTSYASPLLAGTYALIKQGWPWLKAEQIVQILKDSADKTLYDKYFPGWQNDSALKDRAMGRFGVGLLDAEAALAPIGTLTTGSLTTAAYTPALFQAALPGGASPALTAALARVQAFDRYGRNFQMDLSRRIIDPVMTNSLPDFQQRIAHTMLNDVELSLLNRKDRLSQVSLRTTGWSVSFGQGTAPDSTFDSKPNPLATVGTMRFSHYGRLTFDMDKRYQLSLFSGTYRLLGHAGRLNQLLMARPLSGGQLRIGFEYGEQQDGLPTLAGEGPATLGRGNYLLIHLGAQWRVSNQGQFDFSLHYGPARVAGAAGSFFSLDELMMGQMSVSWLSAITHNSQWGLKLWSPLQPVAGQLNWRIPTAVNPETGVPLYSMGQQRFNRSLLPDHLTLFYRKNW